MYVTVKNINNMEDRMVTAFIIRIIEIMIDHSFIFMLQNKKGRK
jgi:hypothetical protein